MLKLIVLENKCKNTDGGNSLQKIPVRTESETSITVVGEQKKMQVKMTYSEGRTTNVCKLCVATHQKH